LDEDRRFDERISDRIDKWFEDTWILHREVVRRALKTTLTLL